MQDAPLNPVAHGLSLDPLKWTAGERERFAVLVNGLPGQAAPVGMTLGLKPDPIERTDAERRLNSLAYDLWKPIPAEHGAVTITDGSLCREADGRVAYAPTHGKVTVFRGDEELPSRSRRPNCARRTVAKVRARARSGLRGGRPLSRRGAASSSRSSSSSGSDSEGSEPPGEPAAGKPADVFLLVGSSARLLSDSMARIGTDFVRLHEATPGLTGAERLQAFGNLPQAQQDAAWADLRRTVEARRELVPA